MSVYVKNNTLKTINTYIFNMYSYKNFQKYSDFIQIYLSTPGIEYINGKSHDGAPAIQRILHAWYKIVRILNTQSFMYL